MALSILKGKPNGEYQRRLRSRRSANLGRSAVSRTHNAISGRDFRGSRARRKVNLFGDCGLETLLARCPVSVGHYRPWTRTQPGREVSGDEADMCAACNEDSNLTRGESVPYHKLCTGAAFKLHGCLWYSRHQPGTTSNGSTPIYCYLLIRTMKSRLIVFIRDSG